MSTLPSPRVLLFMFSLLLFMLALLVLPVTRTVVGCLATYNYPREGWISSAHAKKQAQRCLLFGSVRFGLVFVLRRASSQVSPRLLSECTTDRAQLVKTSTPMFFRKQTYQ